MKESERERIIAQCLLVKVRSFKGNEWTELNLPHKEHIDDLREAMLTQEIYSYKKQHKYEKYNEDKIW